MATTDIGSQILTTGIRGNKIAVSKLCCPLCWEVFEILRQYCPESDAFFTRGPHSTVYLLDLPSWLPNGVVELILRRIKELVKEELDGLLEKFEGAQQHLHTPSAEKASAASTTSAFTTDIWPEGDGEYSPSQPAPQNNDAQAEVHPGVPTTPMSKLLHDTLCLFRGLITSCAQASGSPKSKT